MYNDQQTAGDVTVYRFLGTGEQMCILFNKSLAVTLKICYFHMDFHSFQARLTNEVRLIDIICNTRIRILTSKLKFAGLNNALTLKAWALFGPQSPTSWSIFL